MSELRQNLTNQEWVVIAPERLKGKTLKDNDSTDISTVPEHDPNCPFCKMISGEIDEPRLDQIECSADNLCTFAVENKYKIFADHPSCPIRPTEFEADGIYRKFVGCGAHELIIENPSHNKIFATMTEYEVQTVLQMYLNRFIAVQSNPNNLMTTIFKNHGSKSGASQEHAHSQLVSMRVVPNFVRFLLDEATRYFDSHGRCVFCTIIEHELKNQSRVIFENEHHVSLAPYASSAPYEIAIYPKRHSSIYSDITAAELDSLSQCLQITMKKLYSALNNPDFNLVFRNPPYPLSNTPFYHWHIQIIPALTTPGGFEKCSRMNVNVVTPETAAEHLRSVE